MEKLRKLLLKEDPVETEQRLNNGININDMGLQYGPGMIPKIPRSNFFADSYVQVTKQHRYSYMPAHTHSFIEFNYQFSGSSQQQLNGHEYLLKAGQLLVMDKTLIQRYGYMDTNDLLVNILIDPQQLPTNFLHTIRPAKGFHRFMYNVLDNQASHDSYLIYDLNNNDDVKLIWQELMYYGLTNGRPFETRGRLMEAALSCLPEPIITSIHLRNSSSDPLNHVIDYIDKHYVDVTLAQVSDHFGYNKNYLGNKIKQNTGMSFGELLDRKRLLIAESLLLDTDWPVSKIAERLSYRNTSSLFRLFKNKLQITPTDFRNQHTGEMN